MKAIITILLVCLTLVLVPNHTFAKGATSNKSWGQISDLSDQFFQYVNSKQYTEAQAALEQFTKKWNKLSLSTLDITDMEQEVMSSSLANVSKVINGDNSDLEKRQSAIEFRLTVDSLENNSDPLWKELKDQILQPFKAMEQAVKSGDDSKFQTALNQFLDVYQMIYPSLVIDMNPGQLQAVNTAVNDLVDQRMTVLDNKKVIEQLGQCHDELTKVFTINTGSDGINQQTKWTTMTMAGLFIFTLIYASWKKYKEQERYQERKV